MQAQDDLSLRLVCLKSPEHCGLDGQRLTFVFPKSGDVKFVLGQQTHNLLPSMVLVAGGASGARLLVSKGLEAALWVFALRTEHLFSILNIHEIAMLQLVVESFKLGKLYPESASFTKQCNRLIGEVSPIGDLNHRSQLLRVAAIILNEEFRAVKATRSVAMSVEERVIDVFERLSADELLNLPADEMAVKFGCSRRHLNRLFHQHFGLSVATLRMEMRLLKAVSLLRDPRIKIIDLAEQCDFNHLGLFNTCFKRRFGVTPGEWRKQATNRENRSPQPSDEELTCALQAKGLCPLAGGPKFPGLAAGTQSLMKKTLAEKIDPVAVSTQVTSQKSVTKANHRKSPDSMSGWA